MISYGGHGWWVSGLVGWLVDVVCLVGWLVGWVGGFSVGWLVGWLLVGAGHVFCFEKSQAFKTQGPSMGQNGIFTDT